VSGAQREFDIGLYGATGFVGKLTAQYLAKAGGDARIALAGRSADKLGAVRDTLREAAQGWPLIAADASKPSTLQEMAARARVVVTTVGPYARYGLPLVAACAQAGTDYADLTGEAMFERDGAGQLGDTNMVVRAMAGGLSGGTVASMIELLRTLSSDPEAKRLLDDPYTLSPDRAVEPEFGAQPDLRWRRGRDIAPELDRYWLGAFVTAAPNTRVVRRSNALLDYAYGRRFCYAEQMSMGRSLAAPIAAAMGTGASIAMFALGGRFAHRVPSRLVERIAPKPGTGPSESAREKGHYTVETYTTATTGARYRARMSQRGDFGYKATSVLLGESALALAMDRDQLSDLRGVLTPAAAMGDALLVRLPAAGVSLETSRLN
jgi:short subunit dehydrogenase-like uncharacterized protein